MDKVARLKAAVAAGEIVTDSTALAAEMLVYHRGDNR